MLDATALALGGAVGMILGLSGAGGGVLAVPLLVFGLHLNLMQAAPVGLIAVGVSSALGAVLGLRLGLVRYRAAALIGAVGMMAAPVGLYLAQRTPNGPLTAAFAFVLAFVAWRAFNQAGRGDDVPHRRHPCVLNAAEGRLVWTRPCAWALACTGAVSGMLSGLLGVGGGFVIVPALNRFTDVPMRGIVATSLAVIAMVSVGGVSAAAVQGFVDWGIALPFTLGACVGLLAGRRVAARWAGAHVQQAFAATCAAVSVLLLARGLGWLAA